MQIIHIFRISRLKLQELFAYIYKITKGLKSAIYFQQIFASKVAISGRAKDRCGNFSLTKELGNVSHLSIVAVEETIIGLLLKNNAKRLVLNRTIQVNLLCTK